MIPLLLALAAPASAHTLVPVQIAGDSGQKYDIVVVAEGYTANEMASFAEDVDRIVDALVGDCILAGNCPVAESGSAFNIWRLEVASVDSGVTDGYIGSDGKFNRTTAALDTAFKLATNNANASCWFTNLGGGLDLGTVLGADAPFWDAAILLLNTSVFGGCNGGNVITATNSLDATVYLHEFGHNLGGLNDEYVNASIAKAYSASDKDAWRVAGPNMSTTSSRDQLKWSAFVDPSAAVPGAAGQKGVSAFVGGGATFSSGVWRPTEDSTMNNNTADYGPVSYARMRDAVGTYTGGAPFRDLLLGQFSLGRSDELVLHQGVSLQTYNAIAAHWYGATVSNTAVPWWDFYAEADRFTVGDLDGDDYDDLFVFNGVDYDIPYAGILTSDGQGGFDMTARYDAVLGGWGELRANDRFVPGDFDGDGADDLLLLNHLDWDHAYAAIGLADAGGLRVDRFYEDVLPGWQMTPGDVWQAGDVDGDGDDELVVANFTDWSMGYVGVFDVVGTEFVMLGRYDGDVDGWGGMAPHDEVRLGDVDGDGDDDLILWNALDWDVPYLGLFTAQDGAFTFSSRYDGFVEGWDALAVHDGLAVADTDNDGCEDLIVWNTVDWADGYVGVLAANCAGGVDGSWQTTAELGVPRTPGLKLLPALVSTAWRIGAVAKPDDRTLVRLRSDGRSFTNVAAYQDYVHDFPYHASGYW